MLTHQKSQKRRNYDADDSVTPKYMFFSKGRFMYHKDNKNKDTELAWFDIIAKLKTKGVISLNLL